MDEEEKKKSGIAAIAEKYKLSGKKLSQGEIDDIVGEYMSK